jgi:Predicted membrane protein
MSIIDIANVSLFLSDRRENSALAFVGWIVLGAVSGFIGSKLINKTGHGRHRDVLLGVVGGVIGGFLSNLFRDAGVANLNLYSFFVAIAGAVAFLIIYHARSLVGGVSQKRSWSNRKH